MTQGGHIQRFGVAPDRARALCVFVHGRGQVPGQMVDEVLALLPPLDVAFVLPAAVGQSWYAARAVDPLTTQTRAELAASQAHLAAAIGALRAEAPGGVPLLLAGFSQGACLTLEHAFSGQAGADAVAALTGCRVGQAGQDRPAALPAGLPVYLSGADADPWIPVTAFAEAALALGQAGARLRADVFPGREHAVSPVERAVLAGMLDDLCAGREPLSGGVR